MYVTSLLKQFSNCTSVFPINEVHYIGFGGWKIGPQTEEPGGTVGTTKEFQLVSLKDDDLD